MQKLVTLPGGRVRRWRLALAYSLLLASCESPFAPGVVVVGRVEISPSFLQLPVGNTTTIVARVYDTNAALLPEARVHWTSQNPSVVTIDQSGLVTAVGPGTAQIAASSGGLSTTIAVTIDERPIALIRVTPPASSVEAGGTIALQAEALDGNGTVLSGRPITWSTDAPEVATVDGSGIVTGVAVGTATISASGEGKVGEASVTVLPPPVATLQIAPANPSLGAGATLQLSATARDAGGAVLTGRQLTWQSSDDAVATVSSTGLVTAITQGSVTITVSAPGGGPQGSTPTTTTTVTVQLASVGAATIAPPAATVLVGQSIEFTVNLFDPSGEPLSTAGRLVAWSSGSPTIATVNATGRVTGVSVGSTSITAKVWTAGVVDTVQASAQLTVSNQPVVSVLMSPTSATVHVGPLYTRRFVATALGAGGVPLPNRPVLWTSSNQAVAAVDATTGVVTGVSPGTAQIRATSETAQGVANVTVDLVPPSTLAINPSSASLTPPATTPLAAVVRDSAGNVITGAALFGRTPTWLSSAPLVASVNASGLVTAIAPGSATITATMGAASNTATITVGIVPIATIVVTPTPQALITGQTVQLTATALDAGGGTLAGRPMIWASSNPAIATVDQNGFVTAIAPGGPVDITATAEGKIGTAEVTVSLPPAVTLGIATQPGAAAQSGNTLAPQPQIQLLDAGAQPAPQAGVVVTASIASGDPSATLDGTPSATTDGTGLAQFTNVAITGPTGAYTLAFSAPGFATITSQTITLSAGTGSTLAIAVQPSSTSASGAVFGIQPSVVLKDGSGNTVMQAGVQIFAVIASGGGSLGGTTPATTDGTGTATFTNLRITGTIGAKTLLFSASGYQSVTSGSITITPGVPAQLSVQTQPGGATSGAAFGQTPVIRLLDSGGNTVNQAGISVGVSIGSGGGGLASLLGTTPVSTDASGLATFTGVGITGPVGSYTLAFAATGLTGTTSASFALAAGAPAQLSMTTQPAGAASGAAFGTVPVVRLLDGAGNPVPQVGVNVTASIASGGGGTAALLGTAMVATDGTGAAAFTGLGIDGVAGPYTLRFVAAGLTDVTSASFNLTAGAPTQLSVVTQPSGAVSGQAFTNQPAVRLVDGAGNPVSQAGVNVTAAITGGGGGATLNGTTTVATDASGVATFSGLGITGSAGSYSLDFNAGVLTGTTSANFNLTVSATQLGMVTEPAGAASGAAFTTQPVVQLLDAGSSPVAQAGVNVTASITGGGGGATLIGAVSVATDATGQATFSNLGLSGLVGSYSVDFTAAGLTGVTSASFNLTAGAPTQLSVVTQPSGAVSGQAFTNQPAVRLVDGAGNPVSQAGVNVTAAITGGGGGATLNGTTTVATDASGVATFSGLGITGSAGSYSLDFNAGVLTGTTSANFNLTVSATQLGMVTEPAGAASGAAFTTQPVVQLLDAGSSPVAQAGVNVTASITGGGGGATLIGAVSVATDAAGQATFTNLGISGLAGSYSLDFSATGLTGVTSASFNLAAGAPTQLGMSTQPSDVASGSTFGTPPVVRLLDSGGNVVVQGGVDVTVSVSGGPVLSGTTTVATDAGGLATFSGLGISGLVGSYTLSFSATGLGGTSSAGFNISAGGPAALAMEAQPGGAASGAAFSSQPAVRLRDSGGNPVSQANVSVTAAITGGGATLFGTATVITDVNGVANFSDLGITGTVGSYSLTFTSAGLTDAVSASFSLAAGSAVSLEVVTNPDGAVDGLAFGTQPVIRLLDSGGNQVAQDGVSIGASIASGDPGASLVGGASVQTVGGQAAFVDLGLTGPAGPYTIAFSSPPLAGATSATVTLAFSISPGDGFATSAHTPRLAIQPVTRPHTGNLMQDTGVDVTVSMAPGGLRVTSLRAAGNTNPGEPAGVMPDEGIGEPAAAGRRPGGTQRAGPSGS